MSLAKVTAAAEVHRLSVFGSCATQPEDGLEQGTLVLLGPREPGFWSHVTASAEFADGAADPLDRWSRRVVSEMADQLGGTALFPFGQPVRPFISWALRSGRAWQSPVGLLVHDEAGLMVSYRGAILLPEMLPSDLSPNPCDCCRAKPCLDACPANALTAGGYDLDACHEFLDQPDGVSCMSRGCAVRRACPVSRSYGRTPAQSAFHMRKFHPAV